MLPEQTGQDLALLDRIRRVAAGIGISSQLKDDLTQEAWIRCQEYVQKTGRSVDRLSSYEIRLRCLEARRTIILDAREMVVEDVERVADVPDAHDMVAELIRAEDVKTMTAETEIVAWILREHPTLKLTPMQADLWHIHCGNPTDRWRAARARDLGVTRQNVSNITRVIRRKVADAVELTRLLGGDVQDFFEKNSEDWVGDGSYRILRPLVYRRVNSRVDSRMVEALRIRLPDIFDYGTRLLLEQRALLARGPIEYQNVCRGYHCLQVYSFANSGDASAYEKIKTATAALDAPGVFRHISRVLLRNISENELTLQAAYYRELLSGVHKYGKDFGTPFYRAIPREKFRAFVESNERYECGVMDLESFISWCYQNVHLKKYADSTAWQTFNFLSLFLALRTSARLSETLPLRTRNTLKILGQMSYHADDAIIAGYAERLLNTL